MVKPGVQIKQDRVKDVLAGLRFLDRNRVMVGIPSDKAGRREDEDGNKEPINNAAIGFIMENGAPEANIPPRPSLIPGIKTVQDDIANKFKKAGDAVLSGDKAKAEKIYHAIGLTGQNAVKRKITDGPFIPLSPRTIAARKRRGRKGTKPLIDTAQFRNAVSYVIRIVKGFI